MHIRNISSYPNLSYVTQQGGGSISNGYSGKNNSVTFEYRSKSLKMALDILDKKVPRVVSEKGLISIPTLSSLIRPNGKSLYTQNFSLTRKLYQHDYFKVLRQQQLEKAKSTILQNAKGDGTEAIITDLDGTLFDDINIDKDLTNPFKNPIPWFLIKTGLNYRHPLTEKLYTKFVVKWEKTKHSPIVPDVASFLSEMKSKNIKVIIMSNRPKETRMNVIGNLNRYGVQFDDLFLYPLGTHGKGTYKKDTLKSLSYKYRILGVLGDQNKDLLPQNKEGFNRNNVKNAVNVLFENFYYSSG